MLFDAAIRNSLQPISLNPRELPRLDEVVLMSYCLPSTVECFSLSSSSVTFQIYVLDV
jgi:hypothetical protein